MPAFKTKNGLAALMALAVLGLSGTAEAGTAYDSAGNYNQAYGMTPGQENKAVNTSLRDANGNLTMVNGQVTTASFSQQSGVGQANATGSGSGAMYGGATAIGNNLNVVTNGSNNTVIVTSKQTNNGDVNADVKLNGQ